MINVRLLIISTMIIVMVLSARLFPTVRAGQQVESQLVVEVRRLRETLELILADTSQTIIAVERLGIQFQRTGVLQERISQEQQELGRMTRESQQEEAYLTDLEHQISFATELGQRQDLERQRKTIQASLAGQRQTKAEMEIRIGSLIRQLQEEDAITSKLEKLLESKIANPDE